MLFKPWTELPTPRHLLDENDDLDEKDAGFLLQYQSWSKVDLQNGGNNTTVDQLLVVAPRLGAFADAIPGSVIGKISCGTTKTPLTKQQLPKLSSELYDNEDGATDTDDDSIEKVEILHETPIKLSGKTAVIHAPLLDPRDCHEFSTELLKLNPKRVVVLCCSNMTSTVSHDVYTLGTSSSKQLELPSLKPPFMLSGVSASILGKCERANVAANAIIVRAEGPEGHECFDLESVSTETCKVLQSTLDIPGIKVSHDYDRSLYI